MSVPGAWCSRTSVCPLCSGLGTYCTTQILYQVPLKRYNSNKKKSTSYQLLLHSFQLNISKRREEFSQNVYLDLKTKNAKKILQTYIYIYITHMPTDFRISRQIVWSSIYFLFFFHRRFILFSNIKSCIKTSVLAPTILHVKSNAFF